MKSKSELLHNLGQIQASETIQKIVQALPNTEIFLVGGSIRERATHDEPTDLDLASRLRPEEVIPLLKTAGMRVVETGIEHGTITIVVDEQNIELTTFRLPGPRKQSQFSDSIEIDLAGRDFTVNAMAYSLANSTLLDPYNGLSDLAQGIIRAVNNASDRVSEDPLRILRAIRFGPAQGRTLEDSLLSAIKDKGELLTSVSVERIQNELNRILVSPCAGSALRSLETLGLLPLVLPELVDSVNCEQNEFHIEDVFSHTLTVVDRAEPELALRLAAMFHDAGKPETLSVDEQGRRHFYKHESASRQLSEAWMKRLKYSKNMTQQVSTLVELHMRPLDCGPTGVRRIIRDTGELFDLWLALKRADKSPTMSDADFQEQYNKFLALVAEERSRPVGSPYAALAVTGDDLKTLGLKEGVGIGKMLALLQELVLDNPDLNTKERLLREATTLLESAHPGHEQ
ncbi:MAG: HD domain-containing protein [Bdellovibrionales bacterium]|nr:HD domain-containing protein [Bdellovibrionales bacterium]